MRLQPILLNVGNNGLIFVDIPSENWVKTVKNMSWSNAFGMLRISSEAQKGGIP